MTQTASIKLPHRPWFSGEFLRPVGTFVERRSSGYDGSIARESNRGTRHE